MYFSLSWVWFSCFLVYLLQYFRVRPSAICLAGSFIGKAEANCLSGFLDFGMRAQHCLHAWVDAVDR